MNQPTRHRRYWILAVILLVVGAAAATWTVQADRNPQPAVTPYDPLPRW